MDEKTHRIIQEQLALYPAMEAEDFIKLLYQGVLGMGHLLEERDFARRLAEELAIPGLFTATPYAPQRVGGGLCRVHLSALENGPGLQTLVALCELSAKPQGSEEPLRQALTELKGMIQSGRLPLAPGQAAKIDAYLAHAPLPVPCHSQRYRTLYQPHYRLMREDLAFFLPVFAAVDTALAQKSHVLVGIDGMSAAGKSSLASVLAKVYGCGVVHADDFFLQAHQRTPARLAEAGGNIDYERLAPVAQQAADDRAFAYTAYNCQTGAMDAVRHILAGPLTVLEGAYALHPKVGAQCDVRVFLWLDAKTQAVRIAQRNGTELARRFLQEWVPMENQYHSAFGIRESCEIILDTSTL